MKRRHNIRANYFAGGNNILNPISPISGLGVFNGVNGAIGSDEGNTSSAQKVSQLRADTLNNISNPNPAIGKTPSLWSRMGTQQKMGAVTGAAGAALDIGTGIYNNLQAPKAEELGNQDEYNTNSKDELFRAAQNNTGADAGRVNVGASAGSMALKGATAGMAFGPIGGLIGGAIGGIGGLVSGLFGNKKRKKAEAEANRQAAGTLMAQNSAINQSQISASLANQIAHGGRLYAPITGGYR